MFDQLFWKLSAYDNVAFDLDGTLYMQEEYDMVIFEEYFKTRFSSELSKRYAKQLVSFKKSKGYGYRSVYDDFRIQNPHIDFSATDLLIFGRQKHVFNLSDKCVLKELLIRLKDNGKRLSLITNGWHIIQTNKINALRIKQVFDDIVILSPYSKYPMKPNPEIINHLDYKGKTVYIGDQKIDEEFAYNADIDFIKINLINV